MNVKKNILHTAIIIALGATSLSVQAALTTGAVLDFVTGYKDCAISGTYPDNCTYGVETVVGSWFMMDANGDAVIQASEKSPVTATGGGIPIGTTSSGFDVWSYFGNIGMHYLDIAPTVTNNDVNSDGGFTKYLDWSGWTVTWNGIPDIPMDSAAWNGNPDGQAVITCSTASCSARSTFVLDYSATVPCCSTNFSGVKYAVHLEGTVSAVPIPAAAWLFGSGLIGLVNIARRRR